MELSANFSDTFLHIAIDNFTNSLYEEFRKMDGNLFFSPFSIQVVLFLASIGSRRNTYEEIRSTIRLPSVDWSEMLPAYKTLLSSLKQNEGLKLVTGTFIENSFDVNKSYVENAKNFLSSTVEKLNFQTDPNKARVYLNEWALNHTDGIIKEVFPDGSIDSDTKLVIGNAIHFRHFWKNKFITELTKEEPFYLTPTEKINVQMMKRSYIFNYYKDSNLNFSALELPYEDRKFNMIILLPDSKDGLNTLEKNLFKISDLKNKMMTHNVTVTMPKFKIEQSFKLKNTLSEMGCSSMFSKNADFSGMINSNSNELVVSDVLHKANIEVNEEGTDASAFTGIIIKKKMGERIQGFPEATFVANHPFIFMIKYNDVALFMGRQNRF
ncbi:leukocyte elastase inhibitor-like [Daktulosphaira vitifoliae]|uniref:leukocyte elastase inhibitor-like n=1 Tax=Daktulosphaira vitifoliae TaxID=58002 RepID=UPI0021AAA9DB|nr:leukocyte elastase inhibitor-like [Daktulosphaira vitifoliae]